MKWTTDHRFTTIDSALEGDLIPKLTEQGMNLKLGTYTCRYIIPYGKIHTPKSERIPRYHKTDDCVSCQRLEITAHNQDIKGDHAKIRTQQ